MKNIAWVCCWYGLAVLLGACASKTYAPNCGWKPLGPLVDLAEIAETRRSSYFQTCVHVRGTVTQTPETEGKGLKVYLASPQAGVFAHFLTYDQIRKGDSLELVGYLDESSPREDGKFDELFNCQKIITYY